MSSNDYYVEWDIEICADTPAAAAAAALEMQRDPESTARVFKVTDDKGKTITIDLLEVHCKQCGSDNLSTYTKRSGGTGFDCVDCGGMDVN